MIVSHPAQEPRCWSDKTQYVYTDLKISLALAHAFVVVRSVTVYHILTFLALVHKCKYCMWAVDFLPTELHDKGLHPPSQPPSEGLLLLHQFCKTGVRPEPKREADLCAKELLYYRILDMFAQVYNKGVEDTAKNRCTLPLVIKLVHPCILPQQCRVRLTLFYGQGHSSLEHWLNLIHNIAIIMEQSRSKVMPFAIPGMDAGDLQLAHCFQNLYITMKHIHKNNVLHNLGLEGFCLIFIGS